MPTKSTSSARFEAQRIGPLTVTLPSGEQIVLQDGEKLALLLEEGGPPTWRVVSDSTGAL